MFRVNDVPYDTLPETVNNLVSLDGTEPFAFGSSSSGNVYANGQATVGEHTLYLGGKSTGVKYTVEARDNVYYIDFYTLRVAAGAGVRRDRE